MSYTAVCQQHPIGNRDRGITNEDLYTIQLLEQTGRAAGMNVNSEVYRWYRSERNKLPVNEFDDPEFCLTGAFPHIFMYGISYYRQIQEDEDLYDGNPDSDDHHDSNADTDNEDYSPIEFLSEAEDGDNHDTDSKPSKRHSFSLPSINRHLLRQYTTIPATSRELIFYLFDQYQRRSVTKTLYSKVKDDPEAFRVFTNMVASGDFETKLRKGIQKPKGADAREIVNQVLPILSFIGQKQHFGAMEYNSSITEAMALTQQFGPASVFLTISPNDVSNPASFRLAFRNVDNMQFPANAPHDFIEAMEKQSTYVGEGHMRIPTDYETKYSKANNNPFAVVEEYRRLVENVLGILVGIKNVNSYSRTTYYGDRKSKGVFGNILAMHGVHETQVRGALHFHVILWGGITPKLLEGAAECQEVCDKVSKVLDTMYTAQLPRGLLLRYIIQQEMRKYSAPGIDPKPVGPTIIPCCIPVDGGVDLQKCSWLNCLGTNMHRHSSTCHKRPGGCQGCQLARPAGLCSMTGPIQLRQHVCPDLEKEHPEVDFSCEIAGEEVHFYTTHRIDKRDANCNTESSSQPIPQPDDRLIVWELGRPHLEGLADIPEELSDIENLTDAQVKHLYAFCVHTIEAVLSTHDDNNTESATAQIKEFVTKLKTPEVLVQFYERISSDLTVVNGIVTEYNDTLITATGSAVNCMLLGNITQSCNALFYIAPYLGKNKVPLSHCLVLLNKAAKDIQNRPSIAEDTGTSTRTAKHLLTRTINMLNKSMEVSDTQAVLALLGEGSQIRSHKFVYYGARDAVNYITKEYYKRDAGFETDSELYNAEKDLPSNKEDSETDDDSFIADDDFFEDISTMQNDTIDNPNETTNIASSLRSVGIDSSTLLNSTGRARVYTIPAKNKDGARRIPVPYQANYRFRGEALSELSRHEYYALVSVRARTKSAHNSTEVKPGRTKNAEFPFAEGHPLHATHVQYLVSKQPVLIFSGKQPPFPGEELSPDDEEYDTWKAKADKFAMYFLAAFRPEVYLYSSEEIHYPEYTWEALKAWIGELKSGNTLISKLRLGALYKAIYGSYSKNRTRVIMSAFRMRNRTIWSEEEKRKAEQHFMTKGNRQSRKSRLQDDLLYQDLHTSVMNTMHLNTSQQNRCHNEIQYTIDLNTCLKEIFESPSPAQQETKPNIPPMDSEEQHVLCHGSRSIKDVTYDDVLKEMETQASVTDQQQQSTQNNQQSTLAEVDEMLSKFNLGEEQSRVLQRVKNYLHALGPHKARSKCRPEPIKLLVTGMPGTGKSFVIERICDMAETFKSGHVATMAYNGIAAVNIDGNTLCSILKITPSNEGPVRETLEATEIVQIRKLLQAETLALIIIDEISNIDTATKALINSRLKQVMNSTEDYGGLGIVFLGDFSQIKPVGGIPLVDSAIAVAELKKKQSQQETQQQQTTDTIRPPKKRRKIDFGTRFLKAKQQSAESKKSKTLNDYGTYRAGSRMRQGADLFSKLERFHLIRQQRTNDPKHIKFLTKMSKGKAIRLSDLDHYKRMTKDDMDADPTWKYAPILTATNSERIQIVHQKATLFAKEQNTFLFRWRNNIKEWKNKPLLSEERLDVHDKEPCFWQYFVADSDAFVNSNINTNLGLANGTPVKLHSLTLESEDELEAVHSQMRSSPPGSTITLKHPPVSVNVSIPETFDGKPTARTRKQKAQQRILKKHSLSHDEIVIPLQSNTGRKHKYSAAILQPHSGYGRVWFEEKFPFDLAFAMTVHKAQGRTIPKVVLALTHREVKQMGYASIYVAMSRVRHSDDLRILQHHTGKNPGDLGLRYIQNLSHNIDILDYYKGFEEPVNGQIWNPQKTLGAKASRKII